MLTSIAVSEFSIISCETSTADYFPSLFSTTLQQCSEELISHIDHFFPPNKTAPHAAGNVGSKESELEKRPLSSAPPTQNTITLDDEGSLTKADLNEQVVPVCETETALLKRLGRTLIRILMITHGLFWLLALVAGGFIGALLVVVSHSALFILLLLATTIFAFIAAATAWDLRTRWRNEAMFLAQRLCLISFQLFGVYVGLDLIWRPNAPEYTPLSERGLYIWASLVYCIAFEPYEQ
jgi:hypothetical protein